MRSSFLPANGFLLLLLTQNNKQPIQSAGPVKSEERDAGGSENFEAFYECVGANYPEEDLVYRSLRGMVRKRFVEYHIKTTEGTFLDLGCNRGGYICNYAKGRAIGVDISLPVLKIARARPSEGNLHFVRGDAQNLSFLRSNSIDFILCSEMIEHVPRPQSVFAECLRVLRTGGKLLVTTPNYKRNKPAWVPIGEMAKYGVAGVHGNLYFHTAFRPEELEQMAKKTGFSTMITGTFEKEVKYATRLPVIFFYFIRSLNRFTLNNARLDRLNNRFLDEFSLIIYKFCVRFGLNALLTRLVTEGVRSYLIAQK